VLLLPNGGCLLERRRRHDDGVRLALVPQPSLRRRVVEHRLPRRRLALGLTIVVSGGGGGGLRNVDGLQKGFLTGELREPLGGRVLLLLGDRCALGSCPVLPRGHFRGRLLLRLRGSGHRCSGCRCDGRLVCIRVFV
jgi:hypothetical protein